jgi:hypothetical protein
MAAIYSNGGNRWNTLGFNFTKRDALSSVYKISMGKSGVQAQFLAYIWHICVYKDKVLNINTTGYSKGAF